VHELPKLGERDEPFPRLVESGHDTLGLPQVQRGLGTARGRPNRSLLSGERTHARTFRETEEYSRARNRSTEGR
jgi:hypothetical protein